MSENNEGVNQNSPTGNEASNQSGTDDRGVPVQNLKAEMDRKIGDLSKQLSQVVQHLQSQQNQQQESAQKSNSGEVDPSSQALQDFASDPDGYISRKTNEAVLQVDAYHAEKWLESQKGYKPEHREELAEMMREIKPQGIPSQRVETLWNYFKTVKGLNKVDQGSDQGKKLGQYQTEGPGRVAPELPKESLSELLNKVQNAPSQFEKAAAMSAYTAAKRAKERKQ